MTKTIVMLVYHDAYYWITIFMFLILITMQLIVSGTIGLLGRALQHAGMERELIPEQKKFQLHMEVKNVMDLLLSKKPVTFKCVQVKNIFSHICYP